MNYSLIVRFADGDTSRITSLAKELGEFNPKVVVVGTFPNTTRKAIPHIPIVFTAFAADPIAQGLIETYARPGGLLTGNVMNAVGGEETMTEKRIGFFKQLVPSMTRLGMIAPVLARVPSSTLLVEERKALRKMALHFGLEFTEYGVATLDDLESAFASARRDDVNGIYISGEPEFVTNMPRVMPFVDALGKPSFGSVTDMARAGLLMSYSTDFADGFRKAGLYVAKILVGAKPGDLPVEQASKFIFAINLKTANKLNITVPPNLLAVADEVFE
jgi:putative ABC transport system substrate-binding protein